MAYINNKEVLLAALKGDRGEKGEKGDKGDRGPQGPPGEKGDPGNGYIENTISVKDLGAVGDGITDDSVVIQNALSTYDAILLPEGVYRVKGLKITKSNTKIIGENATLKIVDDINVMGDNILDSVGLYIHSNNPTNPVSNIVIDGINFDGNAQYLLDNGRDPTDRSGDGTCIRMYNAENVTIRNCCFDNFTDRGIGTSVPNYKDSAKNNHFGVHGLLVSDCEFNKKPLPCKYVPIPAGATYPDDTAANAGIYKVYALGNAIQLLQTGKDEFDSDIVVERCTVHKASNYGFMFYPLKKRLTVRDCKITNCGLNTSEDCYTKADGTVVYADYGYYYTGNDYTKADHCDGGGIKLNNVQDAVVERCYVYGVRGSNISVHNATLGAEYTQAMLDAWGHASNVVIRDNEIIGNPDQLRVGNGVTVEGGDDVKIIGNKIVNHIGAARWHQAYPENKTNGGIEFFATKAITSNTPCFIDGNIIEHTTETVGHGGLEVYEGDVINNTIINAKTPLYAKTVTKSGVPIEAKNLDIRGNNFIYTNNKLGTVKAVDIQIVKDTNVSKNIFTGFARGVQVFDSSQNVNIFENAFYDCSRPIVAGIRDTTLADGATSDKHDNMNIRGNSFVRDGAEQTSNTVVFENSKTSAGTSGTFIPTNVTIDG